MTSYGWPAPAKLNLFLHIIGRRQDGYHLLQTVFQFLDYCDVIDFSIRNDRSLTRQSNYQEIPAESDLVIRAAVALQDETGCELGAEITVNKQLPMGAGLGGGSSNAATVLVALNRLWSLDLPLEKLSAIGLKLGADVPVFIHGQSAWAEGVGELLSSVDPAENWYLVINPGCHISTAEIFSAQDLTRNTPAITIRDFLKAGGHNDCEAVVRERYPEVAKALDWLAEHGDARLTGTGACIYAGFNSREQADRIYKQLPVNWQGFVARGVNRSPLLARLNEENK